MARVYRHGVLRRAANRAIRGLLRLGLGPAHTYLLTVPGRKTGRLYSTPVTLVEGDGGRWLVAPYGDVGWVRNAREAGEVTLTLRGRSEQVAIFELEPAEAAPILKRYVTSVRITRPYFDVTPHSGLDLFTAEASRHPVFRIVSEDR
jgi:deazaflavin-dependent oxidoreductase (nitroreductase family)